MSRNSRLIGEGVHLVTIAKCEIGESANGKERLELTFEDDQGRTAIRYCYLTYAARPYTHEILEGLGINTESDYLDSVEEALTGKGCKISVAPPNGPAMLPEVKSVWPRDEDRPKATKEELKARMRKRLAEKSAPTPVAADDEAIEEPTS